MFHRLEAEGVCSEEKLPSVSSINRIVRSNKRYDHSTASCNSSSCSNSSLADQSSQLNSQPKEEQTDNQVAMDFIAKQITLSKTLNKSTNKMNPQGFNFNGNSLAMLQGRRMNEDDIMNTTINTNTTENFNESQENCNYKNEIK